MKLPIILTASLLACAPAWGGERSQPGNTQGQGQSQGQGQDQRMRQGQSQRATGGSSSNSVNVTQNGGNGSGGGWSARGNTPDVFAPALAGGNPCALAASGGLAGLGAGATFGNMREGERCELRQAAALLANMGDRPGAFAVLCQDPWVADAMATMIPPQPCPKDERRWRKEGWNPQ